MCRLQNFNNITIENRYPLPLIGEVLDRLGRAKKFTHFDFINVYHRVRMAKKHEWKPIFRTRYGYFEY